MVVLDASIVTIALPSAQHALHISTANRQWVVTAYTLSFGGLLLLGGRIADYVGRKRVFIIGLLGFAGASALGGVAVNAADAVRGPGAPGCLRRAAGAGRPLADLGHLHRGQGAGHGLRRLRRHLRRRCGHRPHHGRRAHRVRLVALVPAGQRAHRRHGRRWPPCRWCAESRAHGNTSYDIPGAVTVTAGLVALVYGFTKAASDGWAATATLTFLGIAVVLLAAFVDHRDQVQEPPAAHAGHPRTKPRRLLPQLVHGRCRAARDVPVPHVLLPGQPRLLRPQVGLRLPALLGGDHRGRRGVQPAPPPGRPAPADGHRLRGGDPGDAVAEPDHPPDHLPGPRPAGRAADQPGHGPGLRAHEQHRALPGARPTTPGCPAPWSTPPSRWGAHWAPPCSTRWPPRPPPPTW